MGSFQAGYHPKRTLSHRLETRLRYGGLLKFVLVIVLAISARVLQISVPRDSRTRTITIFDLPNWNTKRSR